MCLSKKLLLVLCLVLLPSFLFAENNPFLFKKGSNGWTKSKKAALKTTIFEKPEALAFNKLLNVDNHLFIVGQSKNVSTLFKLSASLDEKTEFPARFLMLTNQFNTAISNQNDIIAVGYSKKIITPIRPWIARFTAQSAKFDKFDIQTQPLESKIKQAIQLTGVFAKRFSYVVVGYAETKVKGVSHYHTYIAEVSPKFKIKWEKVLRIGAEDQTTAMLPMGNNFLLAGYTKIISDNKAMILIVDANGKLVKHTIFEPQDLTRINQIIPVKGGFVLAGESLQKGKTVASVLAIDSTYKKLWSASLVDPSSFTSVYQHQGGTYWASGVNLKNQQTMPLIVQITKDGKIARNIVPNYPNYTLTDITTYNNEIVAIGNQKQTAPKEKNKNKEKVVAKSILFSLKTS